jgi:DNA-binding MarR family transcriptional regulator
MSPSVEEGRDPSVVPIAEIDPVVHHPVRLGILTVLANVDEAAFGYLKRTLDVSDGNLSRNLTALEEAKLIQSRKGYEGRRPRTWLRITPQGREALERELEVLQAMYSWRPGLEP